MKKYLFDTNICTFYMKGRYGLDQRLAGVAPENRFISEITLAELKFGVENSAAPAKHSSVLQHFLTGVRLLPITSALDIFAREKARLRKAGTPLDDFDLLIGATAVAHGLTLVTNNARHLGRIAAVDLEDWTA